MRQRPKPLKPKAKLPVAPKSPKNQSSKVRDLGKRLADALRREAEALEQQTATSEILSVISRSPSNIQPVFDAIVRSAVRLCGGSLGTVVRVDGDRLEMVAHYNVSREGLQAYREHYPMPIGRETVAGNAILDRRIINITDAQDDATVPPRSVAMANAAGFRGVVAVPLLRDGEPIGLINVSRHDAGLFSDQHIALLQTFADQAVIAIENVRLFTELQEKNRALAESLEQQTATGEILRGITNSPTDVRPVFDTIIRNAVQLCGARLGVFIRFEGEQLHLRAHHGHSLEALEVVRRAYPMRPDRTQASGRAILDRVVTEIPDAREDPAYDRGMALAMGWRSLLAVPLLRVDGSPIGVIVIQRQEAGHFATGHVELLKTFADQAVIAIENVRLFNETKEALEQQTATSEILQVISSSPTDAQPVFEGIARSGVQVCRALGCAVFVIENNVIRVAATHGVRKERIERFRTQFPAPVDAEPEFVRVIRDGMFHLADIENNRDATPEQVEFARLGGYRTRLMMPMSRGDSVLGVIAVTREAPTPFPDRQVELLKTFADQAVIAIENVRLFTELQTSNRELTTALDKQTATSDILRVISRSQTDIQPVFDAILASAVRLQGAYSGALTRIAGDQIVLVALTSTDVAGDASVRAVYPYSRQSGEPHAQVVRDRVPLNIADAHTDPRLPEATRAYARARGYRSWVVVPMVRQDEAVGTIGVTRREPGGFTEDEMALLQTFADQAVIAIENARLLSEVQARTHELSRSVGELRALGEVGQAINSTLDLRTVLSTIVARATQLSDTDAGVIYEYDEPREVFVPRATEHLEAEIVETMLATPVRRGEGATGRLAEVQEPIQVPDILAAPAESRVRGALVRAGYRALLAVPLVREDHLIGGLTVIRKATGEFAPEVVDLLRTFATQSALAIQNARLFQEIEDKSRQLEAASQHKSEFLANMSHELRTPLNAIIGFSEVLSDRMFGDLNEKQEEYLKDIYASGTHLLSLINDILDLSKIEAGRMELELTDFDFPTALDNALMLVRERAGRRSIALHTSIDKRLAEIQGDERKIRQVVLNLLSNAIKFTPEGGRIEVAAMPKDGLVEVSVRDTGVGIATEDQEAVFEEFRQVGTADKKAEGTGLGLTLCRKFIELHRGRIWVKSQVGVGSTFTFTIPVRHGE
jgi:GAF domain-containing protein